MLLPSIEMAADNAPETGDLDAIYPWLNKYAEQCNKQAFSSPDTRDKSTSSKAVITASVPLTCSFEFSSQLRTATGGHADFEMRPDNYAPVTIQDSNIMTFEKMLNG